LDTTGNVGFGESERGSQKDWSLRRQEEEKEDLILDMLGLRYSGYQRSI